MSFVVTMRRTLPIRIFLAQVKMELSWKKKKWNNENSNNDNDK